MKKQTKTLALAGALIGLAGTAFAQMATPATPTPSLADADQTYLSQNAQGSVSDEATAETALMKAQNKDVRSYATQVYKDHGQLNMQLLTLAHDKSATLPVTLSDDDKTKLTTLTALSGADFDTAFLQEEVQVNGQDVKDAQTELTTVTDPDVRKFVTKFLSTEQKHLARAQALMAAMSAPAK